jgi:peptidoglycan/xylan/chitin deacetylase (PgdA/CDA1 family)
LALFAAGLANPPWAAADPAWHSGASVAGGRTLPSSPGGAFVAGASLIPPSAAGPRLPTSLAPVGVAGVLPSLVGPPAPVAPGSDGGDAIVPAGYRVAGADGGVNAFETSFLGSGAGGAVASPVMGMATTPTGQGYWLATADGAVLTFGDAVFSGADNGRLPVRAVVGMAATPTGKGYWLLGRDGSVRAFGDAHSYGDLTQQPTDGAIVGIAATRSGLGYWVTTLGGAVYTFGDARYAGRVSGVGPIVGVAAASAGNGYYLVAANGGVFTFGSAYFAGSAVGRGLNTTIVGLTPSRTGRGYWLLGADGGVFTFGDAEFHGSAAGQLRAAAVGLTVPGTSSSAGALPLLGMVGPLGGKRVALTFDDGPNPTATGDILGVLARYHVSATFFMIGRFVDAYPDLARQVVAGGHSVQNHTYNHPVLTAMSSSSVLWQIDKTTQAIESVTTQAPQCVRPPYMATNPAVAGVIASEKMTQMLWTVDPRDWTMPPAGTIVARVVPSVAADGVVLLHDGGGDRSRTVAALPSIIEQLQAQGFTLAPICE